MEEETCWYKVTITLVNNYVPIVVSVTEEELLLLKTYKARSIYEEKCQLIWETSHELSDRIFIDIREIAAIAETKEYGD